MSQKTHVVDQCALRKREKKRGDLYDYRSCLSVRSRIVGAVCENALNDAKKKRYPIRELGWEETSEPRPSAEFVVVVSLHPEVATEHRSRRRKVCRRAFFEADAPEYGAHGKPKDRKREREI